METNPLIRERLNYRFGSADFRAGTTDSQCTCATEALAAEIGTEAAGLYDNVGTLYLANKAAGMGMGDAWDDAIARTAAEAGLAKTALLGQMNEAGKAHRAAIKGCE